MLRYLSTNGNEGSDAQKKERAASHPTTITHPPKPRSGEQQQERAEPLNATTDQTGKRSERPEPRASSGTVRMHSEQRSARIGPRSSFTAWSERCRRNG